MGATGTGKSTFINAASGTDAMKVGVDLHSCTAEVQCSKAFRVSGVPVTLIDTPGFDDTTVSDTDILEMLANYLVTSFKHRRILSGVIYLHRITDRRLGGIARKNFTMFRKLCGEQTLGSVIIATNCWNMVEESVGAQREKELMTDDLLFKPAVDKGACMLRHDGSVESAHEIIRKLYTRRPRALRIQQEIVREGKSITETEAFLELDKEVAEMRKKHEEEMKEIQEMLRDAIKDGDKTSQTELEEAKTELQKAMEEIERKHKKIAQSTSAPTPDSVKELQRYMEIQAAAAAERKRHHQEQQARLRADIEDLQRKIARIEGGKLEAVEGNEIASRSSSSMHRQQHGHRPSSRDSSSFLSDLTSTRRDTQTAQKPIGSPHIYTDRSLRAYRATDQYSPRQSTESFGTINQEEREKSGHKSNWGVAKTVRKIVTVGRKTTS
ncbi:P-loop containing nucleoside triphosphate hydrolase protein [Abortiporus biennis]|nr:P-loop containing nucleoside triphosphate hydrolase protein [Abortiporus biennis]